MAKKTNRVSINALERFCKETTPDIMQRTFSIGDETITYEVKFRLTLEESMRFIEDVVKEAIMPNDGMIVPRSHRVISLERTFSFTMRILRCRMMRVGRMNWCWVQMVLLAIL